MNRESSTKTAKWASPQRVWTMGRLLLIATGWFALGFAAMMTVCITCAIRGSPGKEIASFVAMYNGRAIEVIKRTGFGFVRYDWYEWKDDIPSTDLGQMDGVLIEHLDSFAQMPESGFVVGTGFSSVCLKASTKYIYNGRAIAGEHADRAKDGAVLGTAVDSNGVERAIVVPLQPRPPLFVFSAAAGTLLWLTWTFSITGLRIARRRTR